MSAEKLYTAPVLEAAMRLADFPLTEAHALRSDARSPACGSNLTLGLSVDDARVTGLGLRVHACAIGQASAAIFAEHAVGQSADRIVAVGEAMAAWLAGEGPLPDWPGLSLIAAAREYPGRHGAIMLPWRAATRALSGVTV